MAKGQNIFGELSETSILDIFKKHKYWAFQIPKTPKGQPFDIIACRDNKYFFIDSKHLETNKASFALERIEPNQITSMQYARQYANVKNLGFIINWERDEQFYFFSYDKFEELKKNNAISVKIETLPKVEEVLE